MKNCIFQWQNVLWKKNFQQVLPVILPSRGHGSFIVLFVKEPTFTGLVAQTSNGEDRDVLNEIQNERN